MKILSIAIGLVVALGLMAGMVLPGLAAPEAATPTTDDVASQIEHPAWDRLLPNIRRGEVTIVNQAENYFVIQSQEEELTILVDDDTKYFIAPLPQKVAALAKQRLELRQELRWQIEPQERARLEEPVSIKLRPINPVSLSNQLKINQATTPMLTASQEINPELLQPDEAKIPERWSERLKWLRRFGHQTTFDDVTVGAQVLVVLAPEADNNLAKWVLIIKPTAYQPTAGTVTDISSGDKTITILTENEGEVTIKYDDKTRVILRGTTTLEIGQTIRAVCNEEMVAKMVWAPAEAIEPAD